MQSWFTQLASATLSAQTNLSEGGIGSPGRLTIDDAGAALVVQGTIYHILR